MSDPTNKTELLDTMQSSFAAFEALLAPLNEAQLIAPGVNGDWSIKDILAHITAWQERMANRLEAIVRHEDGAQIKPSITNEEEMNRFNDTTFTANHLRPLNDIQARFRASTQRLQASVEAANESDLFEPGRFAWMEGEPLWKNVGGNSFWHYGEHASMIEEWLASQKA
jgi:hypothetical protein